MKNTIKKIVVILIALFLILVSVAPIFAITDDEFANNSGKYQQMCRDIITEANRDTCRDYKKYLLAQAAKDQSALKDIEKDKAAIKENIIENLGKITQYDDQLKAITLKISNFEAQIKVKEDEIVKIQVDIEKRVMQINETEKEVKAFMVNSQSTMRVNGYIEYLMGAKSFSDIVRRVEGMNAIQKYNDGLIHKLKEERANLEVAKSSLETQKENIELDKQLIEVEQKEVERVRSVQVLIYEELKRQQVSLETQSAEIQAAINVSKELANSINDIVYTGGFFFPVPGAHKTQTVWHYDGGLSGVHLGVDLAAGTNTPIYAMGAGIVMVTQGGCATNNSFNCNNKMGNHLMMIFLANNKVYGTLIMHIAAGSFAVQPLQTVNAGQMIARVGNSGASYGSHAHIELFDLGVSTIAEGVNLWNQSAYRTAQFGLGGSQNGLQSLCSNRGTPCRLNPEPFLGLSH